MRQYGCKDNECGAVFQYERICLGKEVEPTFCPECGGGSVGPFEYPPAAEMEQPAPAENEDVCITPHSYLSCQYCHTPAGDRQTKEDGVCYDCKRKMIDEGHAWEENDERKRRRVDLLSVNNTTRTGPDGCLPALS